MKYSKKDIVKVIANKNDLVIQEKNHLYINDLKINIEENDYIGLSYKISLKQIVIKKKYLFGIILTFYFYQKNILL